MGKWFKQFEALVWAASMALASLIFVYTTFASKEYVEVRVESIMDILREIRQDVREIRNKQK